MANKPKTSDPRGHSLRVYSEIYDSPAFRALSPHDVMAYLALLRVLRQYNNGDLSLPLSRAKACGVNHHLTLARSLRALCAVGLVAITRKGGCAKGGQRLPNLYRVTDRECYDIPKLFLQSCKVTNEWKSIATVEQGRQRIAEAKKLALETHSKKISLGHGVTTIRTPRDVVGANTRTPRDPWNEGPGHGVTMAENPASPTPGRVSEVFSPKAKKAVHRTPHVPPIQVATPMGERNCSDGDDGAVGAVGDVLATAEKVARETSDDPVEMTL